MILSFDLLKCKKEDDKIDQKEKSKDKIDDNIFFEDELNFFNSSK